MWLREKNTEALGEGRWAPSELQAQVRQQQELQAELDASAQDHEALQAVRPGVRGSGGQGSRGS